MKKRILSFFLVLAFLCALLFSFTACADEPLPSSPDEDNGDQKEDTPESGVIGKELPMNMINYSADALIYLLPDKDLTENEVKTRIDNAMAQLFENTPADALLLNVNYSLSLIPSECYDTAWQRADSTPIADTEHGDLWYGQFARAHARGIEPYAYAMAAAKKYGAEVWFSVRMNDYHYIGDYDSAVSLFAKEHPEMRLDNGVLDFAYPEVRAYVKDYILELCTAYDIDGIEYDMLRGPNYFRPEVSTAERSRILREFLAELKGEIDKISAAKGKEIKILARAYSDAASDEKYGFAPELWAQDGSIDILVLSNAFMPTDYDIDIEEWRAKLGESACKIYGGADFAARCTREWAPDALGRAERMDTELLRGFATSVLGRGGDGLYLFNLFMMDGGDLDLGALDPNSEGYRRFVCSYKEPAATSTAMPWHLSSGESRTVTLFTDDFDDGVLRIGFRGKAPRVKIQGISFLGSVQDSVLWEDLPEVAPFVTAWEATAPRLFTEMIDGTDAEDGYFTFTIVASGDCDILWVEIRA